MSTTYHIKKLVNESHQVELGEATLEVVRAPIEEEITQVIVNCIGPKGISTDRDQGNGAVC